MSLGSELAGPGLGAGQGFKAKPDISVFHKYCNSYSVTVIPVHKSTALQLATDEPALCAEQRYPPAAASDPASLPLSSRRPLGPAGLVPVAVLASSALALGGPKSGGFAASAIKADKLQRPAQGAGDPMQSGVMLSPFRGKARALRVE